MKHYIALTNSELSTRISENIHSQRDRRIMHLRLIDGLTYEKIAEAVDLSPRYVRSLCHKLINRIIS